MGIRFSGADILRIAVQIEENGLAFYQTSLAKTDDPRAQHLFRFMAGEEARHIQDFRGLGALLENETQLGLEIDEEDEKYLEALAASKVFTEADAGAKAAARAHDVHEAIEMALGFEKDSVLFYSEMLGFMRATAKPVIEAIIDQEKRHIVQLSELRTFFLA